MTWPSCAGSTSRSSGRRPTRRAEPATARRPRRRPRHPPPAGGGALGPLLVGQPEQLLKRLRDDLADGLAGVERGVGVLEDVLDPAQGLLGPVAGAGDQPSPVEGDLAGPVAVQADDAAGESRLS